MLLYIHLFHISPPFLSFLLFFLTSAYLPATLTSPFSSSSLPLSQSPPPSAPSFSILALASFPSYYSIFTPLPRLSSYSLLAFYPPSFTLSFYPSHFPSPPLDSRLLFTPPPLLLSLLHTFLSPSHFSSPLPAPALRPGLRPYNESRPWHATAAPQTAGSIGFFL